MDLVFLGRQGSGKGTQARILAERFGYIILEMGKECRRLATENSDLGRLVKTNIDAGRLVPPQVAVEIAAAFLRRVKPGQKVIFDSMPRNLRQAKDFWPILKKLGRDYWLVHFLIDEETAIPRLTQRLTCTNNDCQSIYPADYQKSICSLCGAVLEKRVDDSSLDSIKTRFGLFARETAPVVEEQRALGKVIEINTNQSIEQVTADLLAALKVKGVI